jgi:hypothetical protein
MPRSRSTAIQSERTRRRSPRALTSPANLDRPAKQQQLLGQCGPAGVGVRNNREGTPARRVNAVAGKRSDCASTFGGYDGSAALCQEAEPIPGAQRFLAGRWRVFLRSLLITRLLEYIPDKVCGPNDN